MTAPTPIEALPPPHWMDAKAQEVARQFTQDTEGQRRARLQCAVVGAMQFAIGAAPRAEKPEPGAWQIAGYAGLIDYPARWDTTKYPTLELAVRWALANYADTDGGPNPTLRDLLDEVRSTFTRDDDLPNGLLQRIDEALD